VEMIEVEDCQILAMKKDDYDKMSELKKLDLIYDYNLFHLNDYQGVWFCIPKDKLEKIYNKAKI
jgi:hypothetical protein